MPPSSSGTSARTAPLEDFKALMHPKKSAARARKEAPTQAAIRKWQNVEPRSLSVKTLISPLLANLFLHYVFDIWMESSASHAALRASNSVNRACINSGALALR